MRSIALMIAALLACTPCLAQVAPDPAVVAAEKTATTNWLADVKAAAAYTSRTRATTRTANDKKTAADLAALIAGAQAIVAAQTVATPPSVAVPPPVVVPPAGKSVTVANTADLNTALNAAPSGETIKLSAGTYSALNVNGLALTGVTLTSADPAHPATLTGFYMTGASGLTFANLVLSTEGSTDPYPFRVVGSANITFDHVSVHGSMDGDPQDDMSGIWIGTSDHVTIKNSEFQELVNGIVEGASTNILIDANYLHDIGTDGIDNGGSSHVTISNNHIADFHPVPGQHPDGIQFWTVGQTVGDADHLITGNLIERPANSPVDNTMQGITEGDEAGVGHLRITVSNNVLVGTMYNGIAFADADDLTVTGNQILPFADQQSWIVLRSSGGTSVISNNQIPQINMVNSTAVQTANTIIGPPADKGASAIAAWKASHPASYGVQP